MNKSMLISRLTDADKPMVAYEAHYYRTEVYDPWDCGSAVQDLQRLDYYIKKKEYYHLPYLKQIVSVFDCASRFIFVLNDELKHLYEITQDSDEYLSEEESVAYDKVAEDAIWVLRQLRDSLADGEKNVRVHLLGEVPVNGVIRLSSRRERDDEHIVEFITGAATEAVKQVDRRVNHLLQWFEN